MVDGGASTELRRWESDGMDKGMVNCDIIGLQETLPADIFLADKLHCQRTSDTETVYKLRHYNVCHLRPHIIILCKS